MIENPFVLLVGFPLAAYVIGSTPFGVLIARGHGMDLRKVGSGNVGATNVARALGKKWGYLCFFLDVAKGLVPTLAAALLLGGQRGFPTLLHQAAWLGAGFGAIAGHVFSFYLRFRGGKGVATALGFYLVVDAVSTLLVGAGWIVVVYLTRRASVASLLALTAYPIILAAQNAPAWKIAFAVAVLAVIVYRHWGNVKRLFTGKEPLVRR